MHPPKSPRAAYACASLAGFVSAESGQGRAKNVRNILLKNSVNIMLCALCWWAVGYAFAYGRSAGGLLG